ncbi:Ig-like domain-containing protein [Pseudomonas triticicola]|uniref:Ig-like domain-containing protein n=1 Tax=Pseudomonas triticicola TaxID=2842345 RepID=A0ABS6REX8_9PSED|nr:Ig-like domain-containing protein [Pseudomonas triticicola]MBV4544499.1 Ig-like domain-containing protein [Pseudomonas triticicola]
MNEPVVQKNKSLLLNGDFNERLKEWRTRGRVGLAKEFYEGELVNFMEVGVGASATQEVKAPKTPGARAGYELTFLCELRPGVSWSGESGWLRIRKRGEVLMSIELTAEEGRHPELENARRLAGQPLEFKPRAYQRSLDQLEFVGDDVLSFEVSGVPDNTGDNRSAIRITRIDLQLKLEPLQLQSVLLDHGDVSPGQTLYLCLGASLGVDPDDSLYIPHGLSFIPADGSAWLETDIALIIHGNPMESVKATPDWGAYQPLQSQWSLDCPDMGEEKVHDFTISLVNQYNAEPYTIDVSLGHHRLALREVQCAAYYPVLEYAQSVRLGVQVLSYYTGQAIDGREVRWTTAGQGVLGTSITDEQGLVYFDFVPEQAGDFILTASVDSPYYPSGEVTLEFSVTVLATDPWVDLRCVVEGQVTPWSATGYPNRGTDYPIIVRLPADSPWLTTDLSLHWSGVGHEELKVAVNPPLQQPVAFNGDDTLWTLACEDWLDGRFELSLVCSKLLLPSPRKPMSLARNKVRIADTRGPNISPVVENSEKTLMRVQVVHVTDKGAGEPVIDAFVHWQTPEGIVESRTGSGGWASLYYQPSEALSNETITASVSAYEGGPEDGHRFSVTAFAQDDWKDKVSITFDGFPLFNDGIACKRGKTHVLTIRAVENSPLIGKEITLGWRNAKPEIGLAVSDLDVPRTLPEGEDLTWTFSSDRIESTSSIFEVSLRTDTLTNKDFSCRLLSPDLHEEMTVVLDQMTDLRGQPLFPCIGAIHRYILRTNALSPLVGLLMDLQWDGSPAAELGIELCPPSQTDNILDDSGFTWTLDCSNSTKPGVFKLRFISDYLGLSDANTMTLGHNKITIEDAQASAVDPVIGQDPAWMWLKVRSPYRPDLALDQVPVQWTGDGSSEERRTGADGWSGFPFAPATAGEHVVTAAVISPYDRFEERRSMQVLALEGDPWDGFIYSFDSRPYQPLGDSAEFPRRKGQHQLCVRAPEGSALLDQDLTLGMTGTGPAELGMRFEEPRLGDPRPFSSAGMTYRFNAGDLKDGRFGLRFASARLARLSPVIAMSLGQGAQVVKIADRSRSSQTLFWGEAVSERITIVSGISGRPMVGMKVVWCSPDLGEVTTTTNFYGEARIRFVPTTPGAAQLTATVGDALYSESISLPFLLHEPREIKELVSDDPSGYPGQQMTAQVLVVSASTAQPLANVEVMWEYDRTSLPTTLTNAEGKATARIVLGGAGEAALRASVKGGLAGWVVKTLWLTVTERPAAVESVVASPNPVPLQTYVSMTALIVAKEGREPMPRRKILVSTNGASFTESFTDHNGRYQAHWRPLSLTDQISLVVKVENSDGTSDSGAVYVAVTN